MVRVGDGAMQPSPSRERLARSTSSESNAQNIADKFVQVRCLCVCACVWRRGTAW